MYGSKIAEPLKKHTVIATTKGHLIELQEEKILRSVKLPSVGVTKVRFTVFASCGATAGAEIFLFVCGINILCSPYTAHLWIGRSNINKRNLTVKAWLCCFAATI